MRAAKVDANQTEIVKHLRALEASVQILSTVGKGCPDLLVGYEGHNILMEVKVKKGKLTPDQVVWHNGWRGIVIIVRTPAEAEAALRLYADA
jgi:hypothetical protein